MDKKTIIPISDIDVLLIENTQCVITVSAINELVNNGVCVIACNNQHLPSAYILGYKVQKQSLTNFYKQLSWDQEFKDKWWNWILHIKINNQLNLLEFLNIKTSEWKDKMSKESIIDTTLEANVANYFFKSLYGKSFKRNDSCLINSILDYGYIILTNMVARSIVKKGLTANISFFHGSIYSQFPLAYDLVEVFRIVIDLFTYHIYKSEIFNNLTNLSSELKKCLLNFIANYKILIDGKYEFINNTIDKLVDWLIKDEFNQHQIKYDFCIEELNKEEVDNDWIQEKLED